MFHLRKVLLVHPAHVQHCCSVFAQKRPPNVQIKAVPHPIKMCILQTEDKNPTGPQAHTDTEKDTERNRDQGGIRTAGTVGCVRAVCPAWLTCCAAVLFSMVHAGWELSSASHVLLLLTGAALQVPCTNIAPTADSFLKSKVQRLQAHESECKDDAVRLDNCVA